MAVYDLEEQEQLDALKAWWKRHGRAVIAVVLAFALGVAAVQGWRHYQRSQAENASLLYEALLEAAQTQDVKKARDTAGQLMENYAGTGYAPRAALIAAALNLDSDDAKSAKAQLEWTVEHAKEADLRDIARLRLAAALLDEKDFEGALKHLANAPQAAYVGFYADLKGDVLLAQGKKAEARAAYQEAVSKLNENGEYRKLVEMKLDALGGAK